MGKIKAKAFQFGGCCEGCPDGSSSKPPRGGVEIEVGDFDTTVWLCLKCAEKLAVRVMAAVSVCRLNEAEGREFLAEKWTKPRKAKAVQP